VADVDWPQFRAVVEARRPRPLFADMGAERSLGTAAQGAVETDAIWLKRLEETPEAQRKQVLIELLREELAGTLGFSDSDDLPADRDFFEMGMDSLMAVEFSCRLQRHLGLSESTAVFDHPRLEALASHLLSRIAIADPAARAASQSPAPVRLNPAAAPGGNGHAEVIERLRQAPPERRVEVLEDVLRREVATSLGFASPADVSPDRSLPEMGMDSLMAAGFATRLQKVLGVGEPSLVFESENIRQMASCLLGQVTLPEQDEIVGYAPEREEAVCEFQKAAYPERRPDWIAPRWRWMYLESARRLGVEPRMWISCDGDDVVAFMGAIPTKLQIGSEERLTAWFVETMVLESHRNKALGARILLRAKQDMPFALSLGQTAYMRETMFRVGWKQVAPLRTCLFPVNPFQIVRHKLRSASLARGAAAMLAGSCQTRRVLATRAAERLEVEFPDRFDERHDALWERVREHYPCAVMRDASYLNWKYVTQPGQDFVRMELRRAGEVVAAAVLCIKEPDSGYRYRRAFLVEFVASPADRHVLYGVFDAVYRECRARQADAIVFYVINDAIAEAAYRYGFLRREPTRYLLVCPPENDPELARQVLNPDAWLITMGDSDIDRPW